MTDLPYPTKPEEAASGRRAHRARSLRVNVKSFVDLLFSEYPDRIKRRPKAFKRRIIALFKVHLPPYRKPAGRRQQQRVTMAASMYASQLSEMREGRRSEVTWAPIAARCIPGFAAIKTEYRRRVEIKRLRDSVYRRLKPRT